MRNFFRLFIATIACAVAFVGCKDDEVTDYETVYPGIVMYTYGTLTNELALDGVSMAIRLGTLLNEMDAYNSTAATGEKIEFTEDQNISSNSYTEPDWSKLGDFIYEKASKSSDNKRYFLLGDYSDDCKESFIQKSKDGVYTFTYGRTVVQGDPDWSDYNQEVNIHTGATFDNLLRRGVMCIDTNGKDRLEKTDVNNPWYVYSEEGMTYSMFLSPQTETYECKNIGGSDNKKYMVYMDESTGEVHYKISSIQPNYITHTVDTDWDMEGYTKMNDFTKLDLESTFYNFYTLDINSVGTPMVNNGSSKISMTYSTPSPIKYKPSTGLNYTKYTGETEVSIDATSTTFPYNTTYITFLNNGSWYVSYGDTTYYN